MKKLLGVLLTFVMLFAVASLAFATNLTASAASPTTLDFNVTCEGKNEIYKQTGDIITVTFTIENATDEAAGYDISTFANEIYYDHTFFEAVEGSAEIASGVNGFARLDKYSSGEHRYRAFFNGYQIPTIQYAAKQTIGTFQLKILATEGSSSIVSADDKIYAMSVDGGDYTLTKTDLIVRIGDDPNPKGYDVTFDANGGTGTMATVSDVGGAYTLPSCTFTAPTGKQFKGWAISAGGEVISSLDVTENITLYAIWEDIPHTHNFSVSKYDEQHHWNKCDGCDEIDTKEAHKGGSATCQAKAICQYCNAAYGEVGAHDYDLTTWGYKGADGHAYVCKTSGCNAHDTVVAHTSSGAPTATNAEICTVCQYIINPALTHTTHTPKTEWSSDATHHWHECTGCSGQQLEKAEHIYDNACDTNCNTCGYVRTVEHNYTELKHNDTEHWHECACGEKSDKAEHAYGNDNVCDACGYENESQGGTEPPSTDTTPAPVDPGTNSNDDNGGMIVIIIIACVVALGGGGFALWWFVFKKKRI